MDNYYVDYRPNIKSGDLIAQGVLKKNTLASLITKLIRLVTHSKYVHTGIAWVVGERVFVIEAIYPKVVITPLSNYYNFYHLPLGITWYDNYLNFLLNKVGTKYGWMNIIHMETGWISDDPTYVFCSELSVQFYTAIGYLPKMDDDIDPGSLVKLLIDKTGLEPTFVLAN